ncbi:MAG: multidrug DMT transporter [Bacteroidetes bacterium GWD2_45_23]|nr:MAG: multidrug DMT transporter [Bacteroidetes bacterium GWC2_46_850]OFX70114.1 MAG: multidrug DMT transporter [Bacteroidetes bacterium GWC1_47_7]OFX85493.1 MAG: multidrug DMT transporter [Bacteroidetes bacterium GWD2_45_23]HBB00717.1 multidrug DMT transporter [Porphyromonadaceae bacterium]HCC19342.1 multidrug DMT transporter [Porphyromonadaceae bacterium]
MKKKSYLTVTDQFCGAGGSSQGVRRLAQNMGGGLEVKLAMNHWDLAIKTHNTNFPDTDHDCADVSATDPRRYQSTDILITSPECTNHTIAKGVSRKYQLTKNLFGDLTIDPGAIRSRATMWDVPRFAEIHNYNLIIVENVVEARVWIMWDAWLHAMHNLGYTHKCVYLNSMHALPTPQSRDRMYVVFWKKGNPVPDLDFRPKSFCSNCGKEVESIQSWRNPRKKFGKYKQQYDYRCANCGSIVEPYYYAAFNIIDWSIPSVRIGDRSKPLSPNTIERIKHGLLKQKDSSFIIYTDHSSNLKRSSGITDKMFTQATRQVAAFVTKGSYGGDITPLSSPQFTMTTQNNFGVVGMPAMIDEQNKNGKSRSLNEFVSIVLAGGNHHGLLGMPMIIKNYGGGFNPKLAGLSLYKAIDTVTTAGTYGVLGMPFMVENRGQSRSREIDQPMSTQTSIVTHGILSTEAVNAFFSYYYGKAQSSGMEDPIGTMSTRDRVAIVLSSPENVKLEDCTYRMIQPHEVQAAMAFENDYIVLGSGRDKVKQLGNAVTPPAMTWLLERGMGTFN